MTDKSKNKWWGKIETREEALGVIKDSANGFYCVAVIQVVIGLFLLGVGAVVDGIIFAVLAFLLKKFNTILVALILFVLSMIGVVATGVNQFGGGTGGRNMVLAIIMVWMSVRALQATARLRKLGKT